MAKPWQRAVMLTSRDWLSILTAALGGFGVAAFVGAMTDIAELIQPVGTILAVVLAIGTGYWRYVKARNDAKRSDE